LLDALLAAFERSIFSKAPPLTMPHSALHAKIAPASSAHAPSELSPADMLALAMRDGDSGVVRHLVQRLPREATLALSSQGKKALMLAAAHRDAKLIAILLPVSNPDAADANGNTAIMHAADGPGDSAAETLRLLAPVSDLSLVNKHGMTALRLIALHPRRLASLQAVGAFCAPEVFRIPDSMTGSGRDPLMDCANMSDVEMTRYLAPFSDLSATDSGGRRAFDLALNAGPFRGSATTAQWATLDALAPYVSDLDLAHALGCCRGPRQDGAPGEDKSHFLLPLTRAEQEARALKKVAFGGDAAPSSSRKPPRAL